MMRRKRRWSQGGGYLLESFFHSLLLMFLLLLTLFVFAAGINTLMAARALNETMVYTSGSGVWTGKAAETCIRQLPGPVQFRECNLYLQDPANPTQTLRQVNEICASPDYTLNSAGGRNPITENLTAAEGIRRGVVPGGSFDPSRIVYQGDVGDCLNYSVAGDSRFTLSSVTNATGQDVLQPLRLEIKYRQFFFNLCPFLPQAGTSGKVDTEYCDRKSERIVTRNIIFYSQTVRES